MGAPLVTPIETCTCPYCTAAVPGTITPAVAQVPPTGGGGALLEQVPWPAMPDLVQIDPQWPTLPPPPAALPAGAVDVTTAPPPPGTTGTTTWPPDLLVNDPAYAAGQLIMATPITPAANPNLPQVPVVTVGSNIVDAYGFGGATAAAAPTSQPAVHDAAIDPTT